jgi:hypothetical protein
LIDDLSERVLEEGERHSQCSLARSKRLSLQLLKRSLLGLEGPRTATTSPR